MPYTDTQRRVYESFLAPCEIAINNGVPREMAIKMMGEAWIEVLRGMLEDAKRQQEEDLQEYIRGRMKDL